MEESFEKFVAESWKYLYPKIKENNHIILELMKAYKCLIYHTLFFAVILYNRYIVRALLYKSTIYTIAIFYEPQIMPVHFSILKKDCWNPTQYKTILHKINNTTAPIFQRHNSTWVMKFYSDKLSIKNLHVKVQGKK